MAARQEERVLQELDAAALRRWCGTARSALLAAREEIDDLNVFPVPDGDTGTNLLLTLEAAEQEVTAAPPDLASTADALALGALRGARGNSGTILSQLLRGLGDALVDGGGTGGERLAAGLDRGEVLARTGVAAPVEGTVLTVARSAADAAAAAGTELADVASAAAAGARAALARTTAQLPALAAAGVVDAGGRGLVVLLEALEAVVHERGPGRPEPPPHVPRDRSAGTAVREAGSERYGYEVQYLLHGAADAAVVRLRERLGALGDSLVVAGGDGLWNVHVHVDDVGAALEAGLRAGRPSRVTVTRFDEGGAEVALPPGRAVVAVADGDGLVALFEQAGATVLRGRPGARPAPADLVEAVRATGAAEVVLLPCDPDLRGVAGVAAQSAARPGLRVAVVPTRSPVQGLAALAVADPALPLEEAVTAMTAAAQATRCGEVTTAVRQADTSAGPCLPGDALGVLDGRVALIGVETEWVACGLLDRLVDGAELVTVVVGRSAPTGLGARLAARVAQRVPAAQLQLVEGGQESPVLLLGAE